ncbi:glycine cleavage system aminomethyltransferase GcvT [Salinibacterium sp. ZJ454]|uniref:glycine cleavage system aminomethyltransferase GcvT n=1 Tax=Salinibacterium sp. ZJ454 TaxID=2708339 RepID=UPI001FBB3D5B|nr:glycine cleavage system aminomethyltransferase GcvT [Salinibacterium sp. ZJ454]
MTIRNSPLHDIHVAAGATFTDFGGWQMPVRYSSDLTEHHAVRDAAGLFDISHMGEIVVLGPEAGAALDYALAGRLSTIAMNQAKYSLLLAPEGGIIDDLIVYRTGDDRFLVVANAGNRADVAAELVQRAAEFDCEVYDESDDVALIAVQGPKAQEILEQLTPQLDGLTTPLADLKYYWSTPARWADHELLIARTGYTGEDGFELYVSPEAAPALWTAIAEVGAGSGLVPAGLAARDTLRLEAGMPLYGHELGRDILPVQAGLGRVVHQNKPGGFVGQDAIAAGAPDGARVLVGLTAEGRRAGREGYALYGTDEEPVGRITSGALSPTLGHPIALAYVDPAVAAPGTELFIDVRGSRIPATVTPLPFYNRKAS